MKMLKSYLKSIILVCHKNREKETNQISSFCKSVCFLFCLSFFVVLVLSQFPRVFRKDKQKHTGFSTAEGGSKRDYQCTFPPVPSPACLPVCFALLSSTTPSPLLSVCISLQQKHTLGWAWGDGRSGSCSLSLSHSLLPLNWTKQKIKTDFI